VGSAIKIKGLSFRYRGFKEWALRDVDLEVEEGEFILIVGPSGCGKTTLCRCINGLIPHFYEGELHGEVTLLNDINVLEKEPYELVEYVGMVFQDPEAQLITSTVEREVAFGLENLGVSPDEMRARINWALGMLRIEHLRDKAPYELSGGEQQKVAIAAVLALQPKILILDEPTANLDPLSALEILNLLLNLKEKLGITVVLVEHRLSMIVDKVDRIVVMREGRIAANGKPRDVLKDKLVEDIGVEVPRVVKVYKELFGGERWIPLNPRELAEVVIHALKRHRDQEPLV